MTTEPTASNQFYLIPGLPDALVATLTQEGILTPTPIQSAALPPAIAGADLLAQAPTGSGKTLAFTLPIGARLAENPSRGVQALIVTPTRELATQIAKVCVTHLRPLGLGCLSVTGGASYRDQKRSLGSGANIVIGTPGRITDLIGQGSLDLSQLRIFVLDEVDQMLDIGFADDLKKIRQAIINPCQTLFFSATLGGRIKDMARSMLQNPVEILSAHPKAAAPSIQHGYIEARNGCELKALVNTLLYHESEQALIFCETRKDCAEVSFALSQRGFNAQAIHGDLGQDERNLTMERFRRGELQYLVATNVVARGIDVQNLPMVINLDVPNRAESYTHRAGRTGRAGAVGRAWTIITPQSARAYASTIRYLGLKPEKIEIASPSQIVHKALQRILDKSIEQAETSGKDAGHTEPTIRKAVQQTLQKLSAEQCSQILGTMLFQSLRQMESYYADQIMPDWPLMERILQDSRRPRPTGGGSMSRGSDRAPRRSSGSFGGGYRGGEGGGWGGRQGSGGGAASSSGAASGGQGQRRRPQDRPSTPRSWHRQQAGNQSSR